MTEQIIEIFFAAVFGGILGSFANVLILRWHEEAPLTGRSRCPRCKKTIKPRHLVPVLSWIALKGKCAYCGKKIHIQYPLVEAACAALAIVAAVHANPLNLETWPRFFFELILSVGLVVPVVMDLRWKELPVEYLAGLGAFLWLLRFGSQLSIFGFNRATSLMFLFDVIAVTGAVVFFGSQYLLSKGRWLGSGDILFGAFMGAALGWPNVVVAVYLAYIIGGFVAVLGLISGKLRRGARIPFAPSLALGTLVAYWYGGSILLWASKVYV